MELMRDAFVALVTTSPAAQNFRNDKNFFDSPKNLVKIKIQFIKASQQQTFVLRS